MTKKNLNKYPALIKFIERNNSFKIHNDVLYCDSCNEIKVYVPKEGVRGLERHLKSKKNI